MKVQLKEAKPKTALNPSKDTMPLCDVKKILYGLCPSISTYKHAVVVELTNIDTIIGCFLRIDASETNHHSSRYNSNEVYALRDCLIQLAGASQRNTAFELDPYFLKHYVVPFERDNRKDNWRALEKRLKPLLDNINCCLLHESSKEDSFGMRIAEKVSTPRRDDSCQTNSPT